MVSDRGDIAKRVAARSATSRSRISGTHRLCSARLNGGLVNANIVARVGALPALLAALTANVILFVGIGVSPNAEVLGALLALNGFATTMWNIVTVSLRQQIVPAELLGRVNSVYRLLGWGLIHSER